MKNYKKIIKNCIQCNKKFETTRKGRFCSNFCSYRFHRKPFKNSKISTGTKGSIAEFLVGVDLLQKGYEVFKSLSTNSSVDLIIKKRQFIYSVEVKSVKQFKGTVYLHYNNIKAHYLAIYYPIKKTITYFKMKEKMWQKDTILNNAKELQHG